MRFEILQKGQSERPVEVLFVFIPRIQTEQPRKVSISKPKTKRKETRKGF